MSAGNGRPGVRHAVRRRLLGLGVLAAAAVVAVVLRLLVEHPLGGGLTLAWPDGAVRGLRLGACAAGAAVGITLAVSGVMLQALLRNPLADPFILGASSGAGLGVMAAGYLAYASGTALWTGVGVVGPATLGAVGALAIVMLLGRRRTGLDPLSLVLSGVVVSAMCGAGIMVLQQLVPHGLRGDISVWMMGRIPELPAPAILTAAWIAAAAGIVIGVRLGGAMDAATLDDDEAASVGVSLPRLRLMLVLLAGALTAAAVALAGPLAFVGLIAPHAARLLMGPRHAPLIVGGALAGVALVVGADVARQAMEVGGGRLPVGALTAALGGPLFLWLLHSSGGGAGVGRWQA